MRSKVRVERLTVAVAEAIGQPETGYVEVQDLENPHLRLRVSSTGRRSWHYLAWRQGATRRHAVGEFPRVSPAAARVAAQRLDLEWSTGAADELARLRRVEAAPTLGAAWEAYLESCSGRLRARSLYEKQSVWSLYLRPLAAVPLDRLSRARVTALHEEIGRVHPPTANRVLKTVRALWNWAEDRELVSGRNPAARIAMYRETPRDRFLRQEEAQRLLAALRDERTPVRLRHLVLLCLGTGQRRGNVLAMRWEDVDLAGAAWRIPAAVAKGARTLEVPLLPLALAVLRERREEADPACAWVFPGRLSDDRPWAEPKKGWAALLQRAGIADLHLHDLRRTLGSWMAIQNASTTIIGRAMGHASTASTAIYARLTSDPVAAAMQGALEALGATESLDGPPASRSGGATRPRRPRARGGDARIRSES